MEFLTTSDPLRILIMHKIAREALEARKDELDYLAGKIINELGKALKKS